MFVVHTNRHGHKFGRERKFRGPPELFLPRAEKAAALHPP